MMKSTLCFCYSQIHGLMRVKVTRVGPPITPVVSDLNSGIAVVCSLSPAVPLKAQAEAPPIIWLSLGGEQVMETCLDYENWMVWTQVEWTKGDQAP